MIELETKVAVCGHAQHGKSTLSGRLLYELGGIEKAELERRWRRAPDVVPNFAKHRKDFNKYNYLFLERGRPAFERGSGKQTDPSRTAFPTRGSVLVENERITLIDEPGYSRFLGNMIYGLYLADKAIIVVEANSKAEEPTVGKGTTVMAELLSFFEIPVAAICVTKMDTVGFSKETFFSNAEEIREKIVSKYFRYEPPIIPVFALSEGESLSSDLSWYQGVNLAATLRGGAKAGGPQSTPLRFAVKEVLGPPGAGTVLIGILEFGLLAVGDELQLEPMSSILGKQMKIRCRSLQRPRGVNEPIQSNVEELRARAVAAMATSDVERTDITQALRHGGVLGLETSPPTVARRIKVQAVFFRANTVYAGKEYKIHSGVSDTEAKIDSIQVRQALIFEGGLDEYDAVPGDVVEAVMSFFRPMCIESGEAFGRLTRFVLREYNEVVACGRCVSVIE